MILQDIAVNNYKNIRQANLKFSPNINCLYGKNGMGKTNLLDAIYYLSFCKSHSNLPDTQNIKHGEEFFVLQGTYLEEQEKQTVYCGIKKRQKKHFKKNNKEYDKLSDHIGSIPLVMISPDDIRLIQGGSEERRKFIDQIIAQYDKDYLSALLAYNKAMQQRNAMLDLNQNFEDSLFDLWEEPMSKYGNIIHTKRCKFIQEFITVFRKYYLEISKNAEEVALTYKSHLNEEKIETLLKENRNKDRHIGFTTKGVHKDDFFFTITDYPIKKIGSQGQNKTFLIALKLAQFEFTKRQTTTTPLLLLDDIFDKLDSQRVEQIIQLVSSNHFGQIFITDTNRNYIDEIMTKIKHDYLLFTVEEGLFKEVTQKKSIDG